MLIYEGEYKCNGFDVWTGPLALLSLSSVGRSNFQHWHIAHFLSPILTVTTVWNTAETGDMYVIWGEQKILRADKYHHTAWLLPCVLISSFYHINLLKIKQLGHSDFFCSQTVINIVVKDTHQILYLFNSPTNLRNDND